MFGLVNNSALDTVLARLRVRAKVFHNGQYCGSWSIDTSGSKNMTFHVVIHGECCLDAAGELTRLYPGDAVFFPNDEKHSLNSITLGENNENNRESVPPSIVKHEPVIEGGVGLVCGYFEPLTPIFRALSDHFPDVILLRREQFNDSGVLIDLMMSEAKRADLINSALLDRYADCLFYLLVRDHMSEKEGLFAAMAHPKLEKVMSLLHSNPQGSYSVDEMANAAGMSRSRFSSLFKDILGQSPIEYATQWRMTQAYEWLAEEGMSTYAAAQRAGYQDEASFAKAFKRVIGIGPGAVRAQG